MTWRVCVDTGGTFTDAIGVDPQGRSRHVKVLSTSTLRGSIVRTIADDRVEIALDVPWTAGLLEGAALTFAKADGEATQTIARADPESNELQAEGIGAARLGSSFSIDFEEPAPVLAARILTRVGANDSLDHVDWRIGTTIVTNALLTRQVSPTALFVTRGFADLLLIGNQQRPDLFAKQIVRDAPLYEAVVEVDERYGADGSVIATLEPANPTLASSIDDVIARGIESAAICLMHADRHPGHEEALARVLENRGVRHVTLSSQLSPSIRYVPRATTTLAEAATRPLLESYLSQIAAASNGELLAMTSAGGLLSPQTVAATQMLLSGPAAGVVGAARVGERCKEPRVIGFDMGGTSTDVARYDDDFEFVFEHAVGSTRLIGPALAIETVAAGGGSICDVSEHGLRVGPQSAGAEPGPACYGRGGPLTVTDLNVALGRLDANQFSVPLDVQASQDALREAQQRVLELQDERIEIDELAEGFLSIANETMAQAIRNVSVRKGFDAAEYALVSFGGAGGQHACKIAERLGMRRVLWPSLSGLLSAVGLANASIERFAERQVLTPLQDVASQIDGWVEALELDARQQVESICRGDDSRARIARRVASMRLLGQDSTLEIWFESASGLAERFHVEYERVHGHSAPSRPIELVSLRIAAQVSADAMDFPAATNESVPERRTRAWFGSWVDVPIYSRSHVAERSRSGPCLVSDSSSCLVVEPGWQVRANDMGDLIADQVERVDVVDADSESVKLGLFTHRFEALAREMGQALERTAISTNVKERLDFSCAVLDAGGRLVANAPHIPVHLGSMGLCTRKVLEHAPIGEGDVIVTNHPGFGGSHLPDVTIIAGSFLDGTCLGYAAARAHHAEIGGIRPGSMPPTASSLTEEGIVIAPSHLFRSGVSNWDEIEAQLLGGPFPTRNVQDNLSDLRAAVSAVQRGTRGLRDLARTHGIDEIRHRMKALAARSSQAAQRALASLPAGRYSAAHRLDDGTPLKVQIDIADGLAAFDFSGTSGVHRGNLNATPAIVRSAVLYVLRLLIDEALPLNEGLLEPISIRTPSGLLNPPFPDDPSACPAVVGGNVETSQRIVNLLLDALGQMAGSQGTMNNVLFGNEKLGYYETICGGTGAGPDFDGAHAVHSHMTNTRITDPEILEFRYPVRLEEFSIRRGSGGRGRQCGGDGVVRRLTFLEPMDVSVLTQHRNAGPRGLDGGDHGDPGQQRLRRADGTEQTLGSIDGCRAEPGDQLEVWTPGGGGFGSTRSES